jgi:hypothetical protein
VDYFKSLLILIASLFSFLVNSVASQNPEDWKFSLAHLPDHPIQLSQPSKSRRRVLDEAETSECRVQPHSGLDLNKVLPLTRVVMRMITDGQTASRTMAAGSSVT